MSTTTDLSTLKINYLTQSQFDTTLGNNQINENEIYLTPTEDMTTQEVDDFVSELDIGGNAGTAVDLVVEQGTSGMWTYRKWNSGIAECWGRVTVASQTYAANGGYYNVTGAPPTDLFVSGSNPVLSATGGITSNVQTNIGFTFASDVNIQTYLINRNTSAVTNTAWVCWYLIGRWK